MDAARTGTVGIEEDLERERAAVLSRSAPYARALALLPRVLEGPARRLLAAAWEHRTFHAWYDRPLLLLAALRHDVLETGEAHPLRAGFGPEARAEAVTEEALRAALAASRERVWAALAERSVQTNETSRAVAWLWPAALAGASHGGRVLALADLGASAGLNLVADDLPAPWADEAGRPLPVARGVAAAARIGLDPSPLDPAREADRAWLRACIWPGDGGRAARLEAALEAWARARTRVDAPVLAPVGGAEMPARLGTLSAANRDALVLACQTVMRDYMPPEERAEYEAGMREWLAAQPPGRACWVTLEAAPGEPHGGAEAAALTAHVRDAAGEVRALELGRCGFHPERIVRRPIAEEALARALRLDAAGAAVHGA
jgi:hypothetical protein